MDVMRYCVCGHENSAHRHYRSGSDCGLCECKIFIWAIRGRVQTWMSEWMKDTRECLRKETPIRMCGFWVDTGGFVYRCSMREHKGNKHNDAAYGVFP
jgi:hypothetical protein